MTVKDTSSNKSNNTNNTCIGNNVRRTSIQYILNQDQNITSSLEYWEFHDNEGDDDDLNSNRSDNHNNDHYNDSYHLNSHLDSRDFQYSLPVQQYYSSHGKLVPPPPPPSMEMDILNDDQILSPDEFNSIFESFTTVVEGHSLSHNSLLNYFGEDGCMKGINCSKDLLDEEQLAKTLGAIAMI